MDQVLYRYDFLNNFRTEISYQVSENVHHDDAGCGEFDADPFLQADHQGHGHGQYGKKQFILQTENSQADCCDCVQNGENMDDPRSVYVT